MESHYDRLTAWFAPNSKGNEYYRFVLCANDEQSNPIILQKRRSPRRLAEFKALMHKAFEETQQQQQMTSDHQPTFGTTLIALGKACAAFVPQGIIDLLFKATNKPLVIETPDPVFPWELLYAHGHFLGTIRPIGRLGATGSTTRQPFGAWQGLRRAVLIGNMAPPQVGGKGLTFPNDEVHEVTQILQRMQPRYECTTLAPAQYTHAAFKELLNQHDVILHYAGHIAMQEHSSSEIVIGLQTSDGDHITANDVAAASGRFLLVFLNGCRSGASDAIAWQDSASGQNIIQASATIGPLLKGLALAFRERGSVAVICTLWPVYDAVASQFAKAVYQCLEAGISVGAALQHARATLRKRNEHDPNWAAYVLYGDPTLTLASMQNQHVAHTTQTSAPQIDLTPIFATTHVDSSRRDADDTPNAAHTQVAASGTLGPNDLSDDDDALSDDGAIVDGTAAEPLESEIDPQYEPRTLLQQRVEQIIASSLAPDHLPPAPDLLAALRQTGLWLQHEDWCIMARVDLLIGLAQMPDSPITAALAAVGCSAATLGRITHSIYGCGTDRGKGWVHEFYCSPRIIRAIRDAERLARHAGAAQVTASHLALALLRPPVTGSISKVVVELAGVSDERLWEALRTGKAPTTPAPPTAPTPPLTPAEREDDDDDATPPPIDLIARDALLTEMGHDPLADRPEQVEALVTCLRQPDDHHVVLTGPVGVGRQSLVTLLARYIAAHQGQVALAGLQGWGIFALRLQPRAQQGAWLQTTMEQLVQRHGPSIVVFPDLTLLLDDPTSMECLPHLLSIASLRCVALGTDADAERFRRQYRALYTEFTPITLTAPRPEMAQGWLTLRLATLGRRYGVTFAPETVVSATRRATDHQTQTALPGLVQAYLIAAATRATEEASQRTLDEGVLPLVTVEHVNQAQLS